VAGGMSLSSARSTSKWQWTAREGGGWRSGLSGGGSCSCAAARPRKLRRRCSTNSQWPAGLSIQGLVARRSVSEEPGLDLGSDWHIVVADKKTKRQQPTLTAADSDELEALRQRIEMALMPPAKPEGKVA
jgi:hypothetical protein